MTATADFDAWFASYAPTAPECLDDCAKAAWDAATAAAQNSAWLSQAHWLCAEMGVAPGHIEDRMHDLIGQVLGVKHQRDALLDAARTGLDALIAAMAIEHSAKSAQLHLDGIAKLTIAIAEPTL